MKRTLTLIIFGGLILISVIIYAFSHRYYVSGNYMVDRFTGKTRRVQDTLMETPTPPPTPSRTPWTADDVRRARGENADEPKETQSVYKGDFSKVTIAGDSYTDDSFKYEVTCTVENKDSIPHVLNVKCIFYDKNNKPIITEESDFITIKSNDIESVTFTTYTGVENIASYEFKLNQFIFDGVYE